MRESLAIILSVYVSLVLCQVVLNNRQQNIDEFIALLAKKNGNESTTLRPIQNPFQRPTNQFQYGQNQGSMLTYGQQPPPPQPSFTPVAYPYGVRESSNQPTHNTNVSAIHTTMQMELGIVLKNYY